MSSDDTFIESGVSTLDPRTRRARNEDMTVALRKAGGIYSVTGESRNTYRVDVALSECSCPDYQKPDVERCKHLRRVDLEIRNRTVPTPDGRLPERPVADGGVGTEQEDAGQTGDTTRIKGPIWEFDREDQPTGFTYFRCTACGRESMRKQDLASCCPVTRK